MARKKAAKPTEAQIDKQELDQLIEKHGISADKAQKLHEANGTVNSDNAGNEAAETRRTGGHGPSAPQLPTFADL